MKVYIMSGIPGSGKSTWIKQHSGIHPNDILICSADNFHVGTDGVYRFDPKNISHAHNYCLSQYLNFLNDGPERHRRSGVKALFVDNTNLAGWEIAPYYRLAEMMRYEVEIVRIWCDPLVAAQRNVHDVPMDRVFAMYQTMLRETFPPQWKIRTVTAGGQ